MSTSNSPAPSDDSDHAVVSVIDAQRLLKSQDESIEALIFQGKPHCFFVFSYCNLLIFIIFCFPFVLYIRCKHSTVFCGSCFAHIVEEEILLQLKSTIAIEAKKNWNMQKEIADIEYKIRLLVLNLIKTDDMKQLLQMASFGREKLASASQEQQQRHQNGGQLVSDEAVKLYQNLFYLLRADPRYLAELSRIVRGSM